MKNNIIALKAFRNILCITFLFAAYVQFHGDYGPGGGFQAGVVFAIGYLLIALIYGVDKAKEVISKKVVNILLALGALLYMFMGFFGVFVGSIFLNYSALTLVFDISFADAQHYGLFLIELGVGITVFAAITKITTLLMETVQND